MREIPVILSQCRDFCYADDMGKTLRDMATACRHMMPFDALGPWTAAGDDLRHGTVTDEEVMQDGVLLHRVTAQFRIIGRSIPEDMPTGQRRGVWKFRDRAGNQYLIGTGESPWPLCTARAVRGSVGGGTVDYIEVTVETTDVAGLMVRREPQSGQ